MLKREILLIGCAIVLALSAQEAKAAEACTATPTCAALGYTVTTCNGFESLKCPFDSTKLFCGSTCASGYIYGEITGKCGTKNPDIFYSGSTVIGVALNSHLAVAMTDEGAMDWYDAVARCKAKTTGGRSWRLPKLNELNMMYNNMMYNDNVLRQLNTYLSSNGGNAMSKTKYWSSTESSSDYAWNFNFDNGLTYNNRYKTGSSYVRCVFDF